LQLLANFLDNIFHKSLTNKEDITKKGLQVAWLNFLDNIFQKS